jgi:predicted hydrocarbon binding protein
MSSKMMATSNTLRPMLGDFVNVIDFKALLDGVEENMGKKAAAIIITTAGRAYGKKIATILGATAETQDLPAVLKKLNKSLGIEGTRLCVIDEVSQQESFIRVTIVEPLEMSGENANSERLCPFTLGVLGGFIDQIMQKRYQGRQVPVTEQAGFKTEFEFTPV